jgi:hypothetical protein
MPLTHFICPDGVKIETSECVKKCRMEQRCLTLPTLFTLLGGRREWSGKPSTTQLLNGTMLEYLKIKHGYAITPRDSAYALLGSTHHKQLAAVQVPGMIIETPVEGANVDITGIPDLLEPVDDEENLYNLVDYKTYGSYKVVKLLGIESFNTPSPTERYQRAGRWGPAGTPKQIKRFKINPSLIDDADVALQLNHYRLLAEQQGYKIKDMLLQITVRDGGTQVAKSRGITESIYYPVPVRRIDDKEVRAFFEAKRLNLLHHLDDNSMPEPCNDEEAWGGRRCMAYCEVADLCPRGVIEKGRAKYSQTVAVPGIPKPGSFV